MREKVTIVMATYNGEDFLEKQLNSIINQTVKPDEIVIIDDVSKDNTKDIILDFEKKNREISFQNIFRDVNTGYIRNFIDGIKIAKNDYIFLCDQDDIWVKNRIEKTLEFFVKHPDCIVLHSNSHMIDKNSNIIRENIQNYTKSSEKLELKKFVKKVNYPGMSMTLRKSQIINDLDDISSRIKLPTHDWVIAYIACKKEGLYITNKVYTYRRLTGKNVALQNNKKRLSTIKNRINGIKLYRKYYFFMKEVGERSIKVNNYIETSEIREKYLEEKNIGLFLVNIININYYPSYKAYFGDGKLLLKKLGGKNEK